MPPTVCSPDMSHSNEYEFLSSRDGNNFYRKDNSEDHTFIAL